MTKKEALFKIMEGTMFPSRKAFIASFGDLRHSGVIANVARGRFSIVGYEVTKTIGYICTWCDNTDDHVEYVEMRGGNHYSLTVKEGYTVGA